MLLYLFSTKRVFFFFLILKIMGLKIIGFNFFKYEKYFTMLQVIIISREKRFNKMCGIQRYDIKT